MENSITRQPNIVVILTDDQGAWAMGCAGNKEIRTPQLDRLAESGIRFENFFCTSPVCSPARASLLTGRIPSQHGVHDWIRGGNIGEQPVEYLAGQTAYTDILAANGYTCGISGKWHLGNSAKLQKSFSHWFVMPGAASRYYDATMIRDGELVVEPGYLTDRITDDAICFLEQHARQPSPFYLSVHYFAPHNPWINNHPQDIVDSYDDCPFDTCPQEQPHPWSVGHPEEIKERLKGYFAAVTAMDMNVGRILDKLEELELRDTTLICFLSDNGFNCGQHGIWGKGNGTFPQNMYDTSIKVPFIMSHPGAIPENTICDALLSGYDFMPTLLDYVIPQYEHAPGLPGSSFKPLLCGQEGTEKEHVVVFDEYGPVRMIRSKQWKYIHRYPYGPHELYHLSDDPGERVNLGDHPEHHGTIVQMKDKLESFFIEYAYPRKNGIHEPVTGEGQLHLSGPDSRGVMNFQPRKENNPH
ncbi:MAG: sulfatase [Paenibacillaceae bacterium]|nr:sulfatase [Paenibacillaceae bacterium]